MKRKSVRNSERTRITNCLRGIRNAWHFYSALNLVIKVVCGNIAVTLLTP
ncbi:DUF3265 domain-containing protein [Vibrio alginolyticus]|nr:DUF3265 domain-containing protein [Vibrio harveyi]EGQ8156569.1 DUF3265 domain-containing protein [Vibrio alginolyticus]EGQ8488598.1 DUF3265 domain-containing protein [Vibrio alginolyticus]EKP4442039.1 DUF3265 domain-containing protein [Vibrio alginolyticus]ELB2798673.1 DUF3265 domain-containing protein [Vibrio alginolyticus]MCQ9076718.1 DUF3265 domain-containing protein [Vibrio harveyi]